MLLQKREKINFIAANTNIIIFIVFVKNLCSVVKIKLVYLLT